MKNRRTFLMAVAAGFMALGVLIVPTIADELFGVITKVDVGAKKLTVEKKGTDEEVIVTVNDNTEFVSPKGSSRLDLEKIQRGIAKAQEKGKKGIPAKITHEGGVASKVSVAAKKKEAPKDEPK